MTKKVRLLHTVGWEQFLTGDYLGSVTQEAAARRAHWIDSTICDHLPKWKARLLLLLIPWSRLVWLFIPKIEIINTTLLNEYGRRTTIKIGGRMVGSRKWKM